jgi:YVTN family beta-propeller protein
MLPASAGAQKITATVPVAGGPVAVAVNQQTNKIYVADFHGGGDGRVTVIDGTTNATTTVPVGAGPIAVAVNTVTNKIYVANRGVPIANIRGSITVIDGLTNATTTVTDPNATFLYGVAVNPVTNKIYVANMNSVTVIDGATNATTTVTDPNAAYSVAVAVNPVTNKIYVANVDSQNVTVIDGATNSITTVPVVDTSELGPAALAVNSETNKIYVLNNGVIRNSANPGNVTVIDGDTNSTTTLSDPNAVTPVAVAVNSATNKIYVANIGNYPGTNHGNVTVIDGSTGSTTTVTDPSALAPLAVAVDEVSDKIYVSNGNSSTLSGNGGVTVIDGATNSKTTVIDPNAKTDLPGAVAVDSDTDKIYVANVISDNVTVIDGGSPATSFSLVVTLAGSGTVTSSPSGVDCGSVCSASFSAGTDVSLTASPASGSTFAGWSGACTGTRGCSLTMNGDEFIAATFNAPPPDFSLGASSSNMSVTPGASVSTKLSITPSNGFNQSVALACSGAPSETTCMVSPDSVTPDGKDAATATLTVTTTARSFAPVVPWAGPTNHRDRWVPVWMALLVGLALFVRFAGSRFRLRPLARLALATVLSLIALSAACGGNPPPPPVHDPGTPAGTYSLTITATSGNLTHSTAVTLSVQ